MNRPQPRYNKGQHIAGRYLVHQALMGGMGEVYLCLDEHPPIEPIALKTFQGSSPALEGIFKQEVSNWIALEKHPNIVRCFWMQELDNIPFMALEWVAGEEGKGTDLRSWLRRGPLDLKLALKFTIDIVRGLQHAQQKSPGIVHRDLKPDNVLVNQSRQAKITDFGLATVAQTSSLEIAAAADETAVGQSRYVGNIVGTPAYMPPEQWRGENVKLLDFRTDLYAVGCILYELLTGQRPYEGLTVSELRAQHLGAPLPVLDGNFPSAIQSILDGCLAKSREDRFGRLDLLLEALKAIYKTHSGESILDARAGEFTAVDYFNRGSTFDQLDDEERAIADFDQALRLDPTLGLSYMGRGISYGKLGQNQRAIADFDQALRLDPTLSNAYHNRGISYGKLGQNQRAIADFDQALRLDPTLARAFSGRGQNYSELGQNQRAIADFDQALRLDPTLSNAYYNRGNCYSELDQQARAIADYDQALHLDPALVDAYYNRGHSHSVLGNEKHAIADYDQALRLNPTFAHAYGNRGFSYGNLGQFEQALSDFEQALHYDSNYADAWFNKGVVLASSDRLQEALHCLEKADALGHRQAAGVLEQVRQMLVQVHTQQQSDGQELIIRRSITIYQQVGEVGLREFLQKNEISAAQIGEIILAIKQITRK